MTSRHSLECEAARRIRPLFVEIIVVSRQRDRAHPIDPNQLVRAFLGADRAFSGDCAPRLDAKLRRFVAPPPLGFNAAGLVENDEPERISWILNLKCAGFI